MPAGKYGVGWNGFVAIVQVTEVAFTKKSSRAVGCGRLNEGGERIVEGRVSGNRAFLVVTSGRNGAVVKGIAMLKNKALYWEITEEVKAGEPEGDSPLILEKGLLQRVSK